MNRNRWNVYEWVKTDLRRKKKAKQNKAKQNKTKQKKNTPANEIR